MNDEWALVAGLRQRRRELDAIRREARAFFAGAFIMLAALLLALFVGALSHAADVPRAALEMRRDILRESRAAWGLAAPSASFAAQIHQESAYRADAVSFVGARGLAQFMPSTERWIREVYPSMLGDGGGALDPRWALRALIVYDRHLWDRIEATTACERLAFAMAAYNGGLGHVYNRKRISPQPLKCFDATCDLRPPGVSEASQRENSAYPRRILLGLEPRYVAAGFGLGVCTS